MQLLLLLFLMLPTGAFASGSDSSKPATTQRYKLKDCMLTSESLISSGKISNSKWLTQQQLEALSVDKIDASFDADNLYHVFDTLYESALGKVLLIGREHEFESKAWLVSYGANNHIAGSKIIYYDNAEGFLLVETSIKNDVITIVTLNDYEIEKASRKIERYKMNKQLQFEKLTK